jgi:hypothetical protein
MATIKLADAVGWVNARYDADLTYQQFYMAAISRRIPAERDTTGRFLLVDEANLPRIAKIFGLVGVKPKPKPGTKSKPAAKPASKPKPAAVKPARSRTARRSAV